MSAPSSGANTLELPTTGPSKSPRLPTTSRDIILLCYLGYLLSFADRVIFGLVLKPIQSSLHFTDSQLGILSGIAFALTYAVFSPLSGYIVDRYNRKVVLILAIGFWSAMTMMTGLAQSFLGLGVARALVGVGEAFMNPLAVSLIGDSIPLQRRARVFSFYLSAGALGGIFAYIFGGTVVHLLTNAQTVSLPLLGALAPWRIVFLCAALPGFVLLLIILTLLREPPRTTETMLPKLGSDAATVFARRYWKMLVATFIGLATLQLGAYTWSTWSILFFGRVHQWSITQAALRVGIPSATMALLGCLATGRIIDWTRRRGYIDAPLRVGVGGGALFAILASAGVLSHGTIACTALLIVAGTCSYVPTIGIYAAMGDVLPAGARGRFAGLSILAAGLITNSVGPLLVGTLSDRVFPSAFGLRYALGTTFLGTALIGFLLVLPGLSSYRQRMQELAAVV